MDAQSLRERIPGSVLPYPQGTWNRAKYAFWRGIYPFHNRVRNVLLTAKIIRHEGRQDYLLGFVAPGRTIEEFVNYLVEQGYLNHFIAWDDDGQVVSLRRLESFEWQYHLRIFEDGEVRGHYEYTPESHPRWHMKKVGQVARRDDFLKFFGDWVAVVGE